MQAATRMPATHAQNLLKMYLPSRPRSRASVDRVPLNRASHAVPTAAALAQLEPGDRDHLDAGLAHLADGVRVALVRHHHARLECNGVIGIVPLLALRLVAVAAGLDHTQLLDLERIRNCAQEAVLDRDMEIAAPAGLAAG